MKSIAVLVCALGMVLGAPAHAQAKEAGPAEGATMIRVQVEFIEMSHELMTELMSSEKVLSGNALRKRLRELEKEKKSKVVETQVAVARPGKVVTSEAVEEFTYPTEYEPAELPNEVTVVKGGDEVEADVRDVATGPTPAAFETRHLGSSLEVEPDLGEDGFMSVRIATEMVHHVRNEVWAEWKGKTGDAPIVMPIFYSMHISGGYTVRDGNYCLAAAVSPKSPDGHPDYDRKVMIFLRADIITVE